MRKSLIENEYVKFEIIENIICATLKVDLTDIDIVRGIIDLRLKTTDYMCSYPLIVNIRAVKNSTKEVRDFLASAKAAEKVTVTAILIDSMLTATMGNFFLRISKPPVPTKIFTEEEDAIKWLQNKMKVKK